jgi:hypothetical protein
MASIVLVLQDSNVRQNLLKIVDEAERAEIFIDKTIKMSVLMVLEIIYEIKDDQGRTYPNGNFMKNILTSQAAPVIQNAMNLQFETTKRLRKNPIELRSVVKWESEDLNKLLLTQPSILEGN